MTDRFPGGLLVSEAREDSAVLGGARDGLGDLLAGWRAVGFAGYVVRFDASWECWAADYGAAGVVVLGVAMDVEHPELGTAAVAAGLARALATSRQRFFEALDALCGAHLVFARDGSGSPLVVQDATGMEGLCYDVGGGPRLLASHPALIAELRGYELSEMARQWLALPVVRAGNFYFPGLRTPYEQVRILTPNTCLHLDSLEVQRFFPREPLAELDRGEIVERVAPLLRDQFPWLVARYPLAVSLTGGLDTRLTLAATRDLHDQLSFFTYRMWGNRVHVSDDAISRRLAALLGLRWERYGVARGEVLDPAVAAVWERTHGGARGAGYLPHALASRFPAGHRHVRSNVLETVRGFYLKNRGNWRDTFNARTLSRLFQSRTTNQMEPYFREFCDVTGFVTGKLNYHYTDLFYWEHRLGAWHAGIVRDMKIVCPTYVPFNSRRILGLMLARPLRERVAATVVWALIDSLCPEVLDVPVFSGAKLTTSLPAVQAGLAGLQAEAAQLELQLDDQRSKIQALEHRAAALERSIAQPEPTLPKASATAGRLLEGLRRDG